MDLGACSGDEGWKDVHQLLKEQNEKIERLARALSIIQQGMLRNNPGFVKDSVNDATEVLSGMLNTHKCLLESGVEIQKRLESHHEQDGEKEKKAKNTVQKAQGTVARPKLKRSLPARSADAIKVSARDGQSYADILREMKAKVDPGGQDSRSCLSGGPGRRKSFWSSKRRETIRPSTRSLTRRSGRRRIFRP